MLVQQRGLRPPREAPADRARIQGRHDPCLCPRVVPVVESMVALVIADHLVRQAMVKTASSVALTREHIDLTDDMMLMLLSYRQELVREVGRWKKKRRAAIVDQRREGQIMKSVLGLAAEANLDCTFVKKIYEVIFDNSRAVQREV